MQQIACKHIASFKGSIEKLNFCEYKSMYTVILYGKYLLEAVLRFAAKYRQELLLYWYLCWCSHIQYNQMIIQCFTCSHNSAKILCKLPISSPTLHCANVKVDNLNGMQILTCIVTYIFISMHNHVKSKIPRSLMASSHSNNASIYRFFFISGEMSFHWHSSALFSTESHRAVLPEHFSFWFCSSKNRNKLCVQHSHVYMCSTCVVYALTCMYACTGIHV